MSNTHGEVDWENESGGGSSKVEFLRLSTGKHQLRLCSKPFKYPTHQGVKASGEKGYGRKVPCSAQFTGEGKNAVYVEGSCPLCDAAGLGKDNPNQKLRAKTKYMFWCLDRASGTAKVIDVSWQIFSQIKGLAGETAWGNPENFDISIQRNPNSRGPSDYYLVVPIPNTTLSVVEQNVRDTVDLNYLKDKTTPWTTEAVWKILDKVLAGGELYIPEAEEKEESVKVEAKTQPKSNGKKAATVPTEVIETSDDLDDAFPAYTETN